MFIRFEKTNVSKRLLFIRSLFHVTFSNESILFNCTWTFVRYTSYSIVITLNVQFAVNAKKKLKTFWKCNYGYNYESIGMNKNKHPSKKWTYETHVSISEFFSSLLDCIPDWHGRYQHQRSNFRSFTWMIKDEH